MRDIDRIRKNIYKNRRGILQTVRLMVRGTRGINSDSESLTSLISHKLAMIYTRTVYEFLLTRVKCAYRFIFSYRCISSKCRLACSISK